MPTRPGPFKCGQIALALARLPGRLEIDQDEACRILDHIMVSYSRGYFADDEVLVRFGDPAQFRSVLSLPEDAREEINSLSLLIWREAVWLSFGAAKRYVEASTLAGAPRLLREWFDDYTPETRRGRGSGAARNRPSAEDLDLWMSANYQPGTKRDAALKACRDATDATSRAAAAAFAPLPKDVRLGQGQKRLKQPK